MKHSNRHCEIFMTGAFMFSFAASVPAAGVCRSHPDTAGGSSSTDLPQTLHSPGFFPGESQNWDV